MPAARSCSISSGAREAGPSVIRIFAFLKSIPSLLVCAELSEAFSLWGFFVGHSKSKPATQVHKWTPAVPNKIVFLFAFCARP